MFLAPIDTMIELASISLHRQSICVQTPQGLPAAPWGSLWAAVEAGWPALHQSGRPAAVRRQSSPCAQHLPESPGRKEVCTDGSVQHCGVSSALAMEIP